MWVYVIQKSTMFHLWTPIAKTFIIRGVHVYEKLLSLNTWIRKCLLQSGDWLESFLWFRTYGHVNTMKAMSSPYVKSLGRLRLLINVSGQPVQSTDVHILWQATDNSCPSCFSGRGEWPYVVEIIPWSISTKVKWPSLGSDSWRLDLQSDVLLTAQQSPARMGD